jgi:transcription-repair coupling factor (superfamily II helicase)
MQMKPLLRELRVLGCEASETRVTLHLREDTPLDPARVTALVGRPGSRWKLTPDMKLTFRADAGDGGDAIDRLEHALTTLEPLRKP